MINKKVSLITLVVAIGIIAVVYVSFNDFSDKSNNASPANGFLEIPLDRLTVDDIIDYSLSANTELLRTGNDFFFDFWMTPYDYNNIVNLGATETEYDVKIEPKLEFIEIYELLSANDGTVVIYPTFTSAAYYEPGFYTFFRGHCDESCITDLSFESPHIRFTSSGMATQMLNLLGYEFVTDVDVDKNPEILKNYDTIILLHNEYVTQKIFDAVVSHPNIIYLYPNALYAEIEVNYEDNTMTLIRGHNYPEFEIKNGFDYEIEQRFHEYEYDTDCFDWEFIEFENGHALNCYPDAVIHHNLDILLKMKEL